MRLLVPGLLLAALLLIAPSGCRRSKETSGRVQSADRADATPAAAVEPPAAAPLSGVIPGRGVAGVPLGTEQVELTRALGAQDGRWTRPDGTAQLLYRERGLLVELDATGRVVSLTAATPAADPAIRTAHAGRTPEGLGLASSLDAFLRAWGEPASRAPAVARFYEDGALLRYPARGATLLVRTTTEGPQLMGIRVHAVSAQ